MVAQAPAPTDSASNLALALVSCSAAPLLLLGGDMTVIAASGSFCQAFGVDPATVAGRVIFELGGGDWNIPQLRSLLGATATGGGSVDAYELELPSPSGGPRRLVLNASRIDYGEGQAVRLLLAVTDVTDARASERLKDDLLREKAILLQEIHHRVANSLQIIASVLLQNARKVRSEETRSHLLAASHRVMSIGAVQKQLATTRLGQVKLRPYLTELCDSIGASMIPDPDRITLTVEADDGEADAHLSVSMGLIVTELVINALKHAFPGKRRGRIVVGYQGRRDDWTLSVRDTGAGMSQNPADATPGLGTSIVDALANQLKARVEVADAHPGTLVTITHDPMAALAAPYPAETV